MRIFIPSLAAMVDAYDINMTFLHDVYMGMTIEALSLKILCEHYCNV